MTRFFVAIVLIHLCGFSVVQGQEITERERLLLQRLDSLGFSASHA